jgi:hypothetical protein
MKQPRFRGFSKETNSWHYGHGWFEVDYTEEYKQEKGITDKALLYCDNSSPIECELASMGQFTGESINNKGIYHGDIIKVSKLSFESSAPLPENLNVEYYSGMYQLFRGKEPLMGLHLHYLEEGEIVGTMFENPELITTYSKI